MNPQRLQNLVQAIGLLDGIIQKLSSHILSQEELRDLSADFASAFLLAGDERFLPYAEALCRLGLLGNTSCGPLRYKLYYVLVALQLAKGQPNSAIDIVMIAVGLPWESPSLKAKILTLYGFLLIQRQREEDLPLAADCLKKALEYLTEESPLKILALTLLEKIA